MAVRKKMADPEYRRIRAFLDAMREEINHRYAHRGELGLEQEDDESELLDSCARCRAFPVATDNFATCTSTATHVAVKLGGKLVGYSVDDNPSAKLALGYVSGHDFAIVGGRYLADWWAREYHEKPDIYDLHDPKQLASVKKLYGDPATWGPLEADPKTWSHDRAQLDGAPRACRWCSPRV
jgi:hypothetical protein